MEAETRPLERLGVRLAEELNGDGDDKPKRTKRQVAEGASRLAIQIWGTSAPFIDERHIQDLQCRLVKLPGDGRIFRAIVAELGIPLHEALELVSYWGDLRLGAAEAARPQDVLREAARAYGLDIRVTEGRGSTCVVEFVRPERIGGPG